MGAAVKLSVPTVMDRTRVPARLASTEMVTHAKVSFKTSSNIIIITVFHWVCCHCALSQNESITLTS